MNHILQAPLGFDRHVQANHYSGGLRWVERPVAGSYVHSKNNESFVGIRNVNAMPPFLMSIVSNGDGWLFAGSNGPFTAGRVDPDHAIFPYRTADKILNQPGGGGAQHFSRQGGRRTGTLETVANR